MLFSLRIRGRLGLVVAVWLAGCAESVEPATPEIETPTAYFSTVENLVVQFYYEPNAAPVIATTADGRPVWGFLGDNIRALYTGRNIEPLVSVPTRLSEMNPIPAQGRTSWSPANLVELAAQVRTTISTTTTTFFQVLFVNGFAEVDGAPAPTVAGVHIGGTPVVAMFHDVAVTSSPQPAVQAFLELSTVVHEMGHAIGLVNNGVDLTSNHHDAANGPHCTNPQCVMYWVNEVATDLLQFVQQLQSTGNVVMFGSECLEDTRRFLPLGP